MVSSRYGPVTAARCWRRISAWRRAGQSGALDNHCVYGRVIEHVLTMCGPPRLGALEFRRLKPSASSEAKAEPPSAPRRKARRLPPRGGQACAGASKPAPVPSACACALQGCAWRLERSTCSQGRARRAEPAERSAAARGAPTGTS